MLKKVNFIWQGLRQLSGDDAYERYLQHHAQCHYHDQPLSRKAFYRYWQDNKWNGVKRCC